MTVTNVATGVRNSVVTNRQGLYSFPSLLPGTYDLQVSARGFATRLEPQVTLAAQATRQVSVTLNVGGNVQEATVAARPPTLNLNNASLASEVPTTALNNLPVMGQAIYGLMLVMPGVTGTGLLQTSPNTGNTIYNNGIQPQIFAGGQSDESNLFTLNGANITATPVGGSANAIPLPDSVAEMRVSTNNYDAQYGGNTGAVVNVATKSGANQLHGDLYEYHIDNRLSSRSILQSTPGSFVPFRSNEFGGTVGGPIKRNRLFYFGSLDVLRSSGAAGYTVTVETPQFADFVATKFPNTIAATLLKKYGPSPNLALSNVLTLQQYYAIAPGNFYPTLASAEALGFPANLPTVGTGTFTPSGVNNGRQYTGRLDTYFNQQNDHASFYIARAVSPGVSQDPRPAFDGTSYGNSLTLNVNETHVISPEAVNESDLGFSRPVGGVNNPASALAVPGISVGGIYGYGGNGGFEFSPGDFEQNSYQWNDMVTMIEGRHSIKVGAGFRRWEDNANFTGIYQRGDYGFSNLIDFSQDQPFDSYWQGANPATGGPASQVRDYRGTDADVFINDSWKATAHLSINAGLRWEFFSDPTEAHGQQQNFLFGPGADFTQRVANGRAALVTGLYSHARRNDFAPRFGFSWNPAGWSRWVLRGGVGVFFDRPENQIYTDNRTDPPLFTLPNFGVPYGTPVAYGLCTPTSVYNVNCPTNPLLKQITLNAQGGIEAPVNGVEALIPETLYGTTAVFQTAYTENWNFGVQYQLADGLVAEADYIGDVGRHLYLSTDVNRIAGDVDPMTGALTRPNPNFNDIELSMPVGYSSYNGLSLGLHGRVRGVTLAGYYTWSRALDLCSSHLEGNCSIAELNNIAGSWGPADFNAAQHVGAYAVWDVPRLAHAGVLAAALDGWQANTVVTLQSGLPFSAVCGAGWALASTGANCDYNYDGYGADRPSLAGPLAMNARNENDYLNTGLFPAGTGQFGTEFVAPPPGQEGNVSRNAFHGPGLANVDFGLNKRFRASERWTVQIGAQAFNLFNRVNLGQVDGNINDASFGKVTNIAGNPRTIQLLAKILF